MKIQYSQSEQIYAAYENVDLFCEKMEKAVRQLKLNRELFSLQLMLREGLINAVKHGCGNNENLKIDCSLTIYNNEYIIEIEDPGNGFSLNTTGKVSGLRDTSGRGISIIRKYSSSFYYNEKGNKLTIRKKIIMES